MDIRYICLSDLHLGADNSLLTNLKPGTAEVDCSRPSAVLSQLAVCLRSLIGAQQTRPTLILNGDFLELALAQDQIALEAFERFLDLLFPAAAAPLVAESMIFIPGNHDHHLWETARETQYVEYVKKKSAAEPLEAPWHTTKMFDADLVDAYLLNTVIQRVPDRQAASIGTVYPNFGLMSDDGSRCVIFTHGHFTESIYTLMSSFRKFLFPQSAGPTQVWDVEEENFAWIDFFWSTMGRSGAVGVDVKRMYTMLLVPKMRKKLAKQVGDGIARAMMPHVPGAGWFFGCVVDFVFDHLSGLEKTRTDMKLSDESAAGLRAYLEKPVLNQFAADRKTMPPNASVVFGHTHKPFVDTMTFAGFPEQTAVFNSGGWVVDTPGTEPSHGASLVFVDDRCRVASLRVYNEDSYTARVEVVDRDPSANPLYCRLKDLVAAAPACWDGLAQAIASDVQVRHANFQRSLKAMEK